MALIISQAASRQTPDAGQGGNAVTGDTNTGHASTTATGSGGNSEQKTCRWFSFSLVSGVRVSITLKIDHTSSGTLAGPTPSNEFTLEYSLNGGGAWNTAVSRSNFTSSQGPTTFSVALPVSQDISQVQVRDKMRGVSVDLADTATATATIANIKLEVVIQDPKPIVIM